MNKIGINIKRTREEKNISRKELSKKANITPSALANYENGYRTPSDDILKNISFALDVDINYLLGKTTFKDFEGEQLREFEHIIDSIINCSDSNVVKASANIIESLSLLLNSPINMKRLGELKILNEYINLIKDISVTLESNNAFYRHINKNTLSITEVEDFLSDANKRFTDITSAFYDYSNDMKTIQTELRNSSLNDDLLKFIRFYEETNNFSINENYDFYSFESLNNQEANFSKTISLEDFTENEIQDIYKYIEFIKYKRNEKNES